MLELHSLNEAQRKAVTHGEGHLLVLAGPGSGKTFVITQRIFYLIQERSVRPEDILVVTFTRDAALSMQKRFTEQSKNQVYPVNFGTFHSIFYHIIRESQGLHGYKMITESGRRELMLSVLRKLSPASSAEDAAAFLSAVSFAQNTGRPDLAKAKLPGEWRALYREAAHGYEMGKRRKRLLDFDDMVCRCRELLEEDERARDYWQRRFSHILMDEFQDSNPAQYDVVKLLAGKGSRLFAVGDDDQAIYGFRGASPSCLRQFSEEFDAGRINLTVNYRSCGEIVEASLKVISENRERFPKALKSARGAGRETFPVKLIPFLDSEAQYSFLADRLAEQSAGRPAEEKEAESLAVLFRTNSDMQGFAACLGRRGIPFFMREKVTSIYQHFIVQDIFAYLRLARGEEDRELFLRILNRPLRYLNREALGTGRESPFLSMREYYMGRERLAYRRERLRAVEKLERDLGQIGRLPLYLGVQYLLKSVGYEAYLKERAGHREERRQEWERICEWAKGEAKQYGNLESWLGAAEAYEENLRQMDRHRQEAADADRTGAGRADADRTGADRSGIGRAGADRTDADRAGSGCAGRVQLMTVHASKGLEFDRVWIPNCNENVFPHGRGCDNEVCEEERRIFYVAMTRAKKSLELLFLTGTKDHPRLPSRFLNPLFADYSSEPSIISSNSQLSKNSSNASATRSYSSSSSI